MNSPRKKAETNPNKVVYLQVNENELSAAERQIIDQGLQDIENGNVIPHAAVFEMAAKWLKNK